MRKLREETFDLLISDINMPGNEGLALVRKAPQVAEGLPIILLTGHPTVDSAMQSVRLPVMAYLVKPADPKELAELAGQAVANSKAFRSLTASRQRLAEWAKDLEKIEQALRVTPPSKSATPLKSYLGVTLQNLLLILGDWKTVMDASGSAAESAGQGPVVAALRETIEVLQKTKQSFKSRELGDLRKKLEELLESSKAENVASKAKV